MNKEFEATSMSRWSDILEFFGITQGDRQYWLKLGKIISSDYRDYVGGVLNAEVSAFSWFQELETGFAKTIEPSHYLNTFLTLTFDQGDVEELYNQIERFSTAAYGLNIKAPHIFQAVHKFEETLTALILQLAPEADEQAIAISTIGKAIRSSLYVMMETFRTEEEKLLNLQYEEVSRKNAQIEEAHKKVATLLNNSEEGFLSFNESFVIDPEYSQECLNIFGGPIGGQKIDDVLFPGDEHAKARFAKSLNTVYRFRNDAKLDMLLELLPKEICLGAKWLTVKYRLLDDGQMIVILVDSTAEKELKERIADEQKKLKFVITAIKEKDDFFSLLDECQKFNLEEFDRLFASEINDQEKFAIVYRRIHTFKGLFSQLEFIHLPRSLHTMETHLSRLRDMADFRESSIRRARKDSACIEAVEKDKEIINQVFGVDFFARKGEVSIPEDRLPVLDAAASTLLEQCAQCENNSRSVIMEALNEVLSLRQVNFKQLLSAYTKYTYDLAERMGKKIFQFEVTGDDWKVAPEIYGPFAKSLIHVFRNAIDHGIEEPDARVELGKTETAKVSCEVEVRDETLIVCISDDGRGINVDKVKSKAVERGLLDAQAVAAMPEDQVIDLIFHDAFSTREEIDCLGGRGVGMSAVKAELEALNGTVRITTFPGQGTYFKFSIPL